MQYKYIGQIKNTEESRKYWNINVGSSLGLNFAWGLLLSESNSIADQEQNMLILLAACRVY
jgi:hypothetical protein